MNKWIKAFRLRTLPLAFSSILMGAMLAYEQGYTNSSVLILAIVTTLFLQILSNLANDYGDFLKGTDNNERIGPTRTMQSGEITKSQMKKAIYLFSFLSLISGIYLIVLSLGEDLWSGLLFLSLGLLSIAAAIKYTVGKSA